MNVQQQCALQRAAAMCKQNQRNNAPWATCASKVPKVGFPLAQWTTRPFWPWRACPPRPKWLLDARCGHGTCFRPVVLKIQHDLDARPVALQRIKLQLGTALRRSITRPASATESEWTCAPGGKSRYFSTNSGMVMVRSNLCG